LGEPIKIGQITPLSGPNALAGQLTSYGAEIAIAEINEAGGLLGRPVELIVEDGKADPTESVNAAEKLLTRDEVDVLVGCWASSATLAVIPVVEEHGVPFVVEISTNPAITKQGVEWVFRTSSNEELNSQFLGGTAVNKLGFGKIAYLAVNNDWGRGAAENYTKIIEETGGEVILTEYSDSTEVNFYAVLNNVAASGADSLVVTHGLTTMANIFRQMKELELDLPVLLTSGQTIEAMTEAAGGDSSIFEGFYGLGYTLPAGFGVLDKVTTFADKFAATYPELPIARGAANGYDAMYVIAEAIRTAGSTEAEAVRDALGRVSYQGVGGLLEFDDENQAHPQLYLLQVQDGKQVIVDLD
jgi:branched-chain amino acid transport system substrate-binding protein